MGRCKYCGKYVGLFSKVHKKCAEKQSQKLVRDNAESKTHISDSLVWLPSNKVCLKEALRLIVTNRGCQLLTDGQSINLLYDIVDFSEHQAAKSVLRELFYNNALKNIACGDNDQKIIQQLEFVKLKALNDFGFDKDIVDYVVTSIKYSLGIEDATNEEDNILKENSKGSSFTPTIQVSQNSTNHLTFWGIPMGQSIIPFKNLLEKQGYGVKPYNNSKEVGLSCGAYGYTKEFLDYGSHIYVYESPYSHIVYKVDVWFYDMFKKSLQLYEEIYPLLIHKYGTPYHDDKIHKKGPSVNKGVIFHVPEGTISFLFGSYDRVEGFLLHLTYEDKSTLSSICQELSKFEEEMRLKKEQEEKQHQNRLFNYI